MITTPMIEEAFNKGLPELKELFEKLPKEDCLKGLGILVILGISKVVIDAIKDIVLSKTT